MLPKQLHPQIVSVQTGRSELLPAEAPPRPLSSKYSQPVWLEKDGPSLQKLPLLCGPALWGYKTGNMVAGEDGISNLMRCSFIGLSFCSLDSTAGMVGRRAMCTGWQVCSRLSMGKTEQCESPGQSEAFPAKATTMKTFLKTRDVCRQDLKCQDASITI